VKPNIEVRIDELVLRGFASGDRYRIGEAIEGELARLFAEQGAARSLSRNADMMRLDGGAFGFARGSRAETIGAHIAEAVFGGLGR